MRETNIQLLTKKNGFLSILSVFSLFISHSSFSTVLSQINPIHSPQQDAKKKEMDVSLFSLLNN